MRFDDSLRTVLAGDATTAFGAASAWRQLVDLIGRGRALATEEAMIRLHAIRDDVPVAVRAASARSLALAAPGVALAGLFARDDVAVAAPVLRAAVLSADEWVALLPVLSPGNRAVLRHRRDLPGAVVRALESYGPVDFVLSAGTGRAAAGDPEAFVTDAPPPDDVPVVDQEPSPASLVEEAGPMPHRADGPAPIGGNGFPIQDLVVRIAAFQRERETTGQRRPGAANPSVDPKTTSSIAGFRFKTDPQGTIRWADAPTRGALIGLCIADASPAARVGVDGAVAGAVRRRASFRDGRLQIAGTSLVSGPWRLSGEPVFDPASGRFTGYAGTARRPRVDESATPGTAAVDGLRQLMHEFRTPANAIAGFAELIEREMLGAVAPEYRSRAVTIRERAADLVAAIDDLDVAARIEGGALELRPGSVPLASLLARAVDDLAGLASVRGATLSLVPVAASLAIEADDRAADRLVGRLLAALLSVAAPGERLTIAAMRDGGSRILLAVDRPRALATVGTAQLFDLHAEAEAALPGAPLLGTGFSLRLVQSLATELGGALRVDQRRLTLLLPTALDGRMDQASSH